MTKDEAAQIATQAHFDCGVGIELWNGEMTAETIKNFMFCFAKLVAENERKECAKVCENLIHYGSISETQKLYNKAYSYCIEDILARDGK